MSVSDPVSDPRAALRMAESNVLRAEAAVERYSARQMRSNGFGVMETDDDERSVHADLAEARATLLDVQADFILNMTGRCPTCGSSPRE